MKKAILLLTICALTVASYAQTATRPWGVGAGVAFTDFVNPINGQYLMFERYKGAANLNVSRYLGKSFDGRINFTYGSVFYPYDKGQLASNQSLPISKKGNMTYLPAELWDGSLNLVYKFANGYIFKENARFAPYLFTGIGASLINSIGTIGGAGTDNVNPNIPVGLGFNFNINDQWNAQIESQYKMALGDAHNYTQTAIRLGYNFGKGTPAPVQATVTPTEDATNANWCNYNWKVGVGPVFNSFQGPITGQNFMFDQYTTNLGVNITKYLSRFFDARLGLGFGNVYYPKETDAKTTYPTVNKFKTYYAPAQMLDMNLQAIFKTNNGSWLKENAIFAPYAFAGLGANWITSIGSWNSEGNDDINFNLSTGIGFNFRTSDRFALQIEGGRMFNVDNAYSYNQGAIRAQVALGKGNCNGAVSTSTPTEVSTVKDSDGDGINDLTDECPMVAGTAEFFGCPDSDQDGIGDSRDKCPFEKGDAANGGCPGVNPTPAPTEVTPVTPVTPATPTKKLVQSFEVFFANGTNYAPGQVETLQKIAQMLKNNPNYTVVIDGNTYKGGTKALSQLRAEKVAGTLKMKGVNVSNASTEGFGDSRPKYNNSKDNRAEIQIFE